MNKTQILLEKLSAGELQKLAEELLPRISSKYQRIVHSGAVEGTTKTRKGTPDLWIRKQEGGFIYIQVTTDRSKGKMIEDLKKSIDSLEALRRKPQSECVAFTSFNPQPEDIEKCESLCQQNGIGFDFFNSFKIAGYLDERQNHDLRLKHLDIQPELSVFMSLDDFKNRMERKSRKLPFSTTFVGREEDIQKVIGFVRSGKRIIVVYGDPGVGKTRFCIELSKRIEELDTLPEYQIRFVRETNENLAEAIRSDLDARKQYVIIADDLNRLDRLSMLLEIIVDPNRMEGSLLIVSTRSYNVGQVMKELRRGKIEDVETLRIRRLSNADIDAILLGEPFCLTSQRARKEVVLLAKGNPRMAVIAGEILKGGGQVSGSSPYELFEQYFEGVFSELSSLLDTSKDKILLATIAALRIVNPSDPKVIAKLSSTIGFKHEKELRESLAHLSSSEVLEILPSGTVARIFDDSVSEYIVFRYFFDDKTKFLDFERDIIEPFGEDFASHIFENLVALTSKGYESNELKRILSRLPRRTYKVLFGQFHKHDKMKHLQWMEKFAPSSPEESFAVVQEYTQCKGFENISPDEANSIVEITKQSLYANWQKLLVSATQLLRDFALTKEEHLSTSRKSAHDILANVFKYLAPIPVNDKYVRWFYEPQRILIDEVEKWVSPDLTESEAHLIIDLLGQLCSHHFEKHEMDYIDRMKFHMSAGSLYLTDGLKYIRSKTFASLTRIYLTPSVNAYSKLKILESFESAFSPLLPFGGSPSKELMEFDAETLLPYLEHICSTEKHLVLTDNLWNLLKIIETILNGGHATTVRKSLESPHFRKFQRFFGTYWDRRELRLKWKILQKEQEKFVLKFISGIGEANCKDFIDALSEIQEHASLKKSYLPMMSQVFYHLGSLKSNISKSVLEDISQSSHPLFPYTANLLIGISVNNVEVKRKIAKEWLASKEMERLRAVAASYSGRAHPSPAKDDLEILDGLISLQDETVDWSLVNALQNFQIVDAEWLANRLLEIANRATPRVYSDILMRIEPSKEHLDFHYRIYETHSDIFKDIIFASIRFPDLSADTLSPHLANCLKQLSVQDFDALFEYFLGRLDLYLKSLKEQNYGYEAFPHYHFDLSFVRENNKYRQFVINILVVAQKGREYFRPCVNFLRSILGYDFDDGASEELDNTTFEVFVEWINGTGDQLKTILAILHEIHPWQSWFDVIRHVVKRTSDQKVWRDLYSVLYLGAHSGPTSLFYKGRLEMIRKQEREDDSIEMKQFLEGAKLMLEDMIEREEEREYEEAEVEMY